MKTCIFLFLHLALLPLNALVWSTVQTLSGMTDQVDYPQVGIDSVLGNGIVAWTVHNINDGNIEVAISTTPFPTPIWPTRTNLFVGFGKTFFASSLSFNPSGNAIIAAPFYNTTTGKNEIVSSIRSSGSWQTPITLSTNGDNSLEPIVFMNNDDDGIAVWLTSNGLDWETQSKMRISGIWGSLEIISNDTHDTYRPQASSYNTEDAVAVWKVLDNNNVIKATERLLGSWTTPHIISNSSEFSLKPSLAANDSGDAICAWQSTPDQNLWSIEAATFINDSWSSYEIISPANTYNVETNAAINSSGDGIVVWVQINDQESNIYASILSSGVWGSPLNISGSFSDASKPKAAIDDNGNAIAIWQEIEGTNQTIWSRSFTSGTWDTQERISDETGTFQDAQVAVNGSGAIIVAWKEVTFDFPFESGSIQVTMSSLL